MAKQIFTPFVQLREFDDLGRLLANGKMFFCVAGGDISQLGNVYGDSVGTPIANPVILDGAGTAKIYGDPVAYHIFIQDADGVQIYEIDNVFPFGEGGSTSGGSIGIALTYTGLRTLSQDFGAVIVCGRDIPGDGGQGLFVRSTSGESDNDGTILVRGSTRYLRQYSGYIDPRWFGVVYDDAQDQMAALAAATAVGSTQIAGQVYIGQDAHLAGSLSIISGGFYANLSPKLYLDGRLIEACPLAFGDGITVVLGRNVAEEIRTSWFSSIPQSLCSEFGYAYNVDADATIAANLSIPANYSVDFLGGARWTVTDGASISIENLIYNGAGQILKWNDIADISTVDLGGAVAPMEWFGGVAGTSFGIDNTIAAKAWFFSGAGRLVGDYYRVNNSGAQWVTSKAFTASGAGIIDCDNATRFLSLDLGGITWTGKGTITVDGACTLNQATVTGLIATTSGAQDFTASVYTPKSYSAFGVSLARRSSDLTTWANLTGPTGAIRGAAVSGQWMLAGNTEIWRSVDGTNWASIPLGAQQFNKVRYLNSKWVAVGNAGTIYSSTDGITWTLRTPGTSTNLTDIAWTSGAGWVVVGAGSFVATSADLITWTPRAVSTTGDLACIASSGSALVASGNLGGAYLRSTDGATWEESVLVNAEVIYSATGTATNLVLTGAAGNIYKSSNGGATFSKVAVSNAPLLSSYSADGDWIIGSTSGNTWQSSDLVNFTAHNVGISSDVLALVTLPSIYALVGKANAVRTSTNGIDWTAQTVGGIPGDWLNVRTILGVSYLVGKAGRIAYTVDFRTFQLATSGTSEDLYDIGYIDGQYLVVGTNGVMRSAPEVAIAAPTWTAQTVVAAGTILRIASNGASLVLATADEILQGATVSTIEKIDHRFNGIVRSNNAWFLYGDGGTLYTSTNFLQWAKVESGTTSDLVDAATVGTVVVIVGHSGAITYSATGATFTATTSGGDNINGVAYNSGRAEFGICTEGGKSYRSTDGGATWILMDSVGGAVFKGIWSVGSEWNVCGLANRWRYSSDAVTWTQRVGGVGGTPAGPNQPDFDLGQIVDLYSGEGSIAVGDYRAGAIDAPTGGVIYSTALFPDSRLAYSPRIAPNVSFRKIKNGTLLDSNGNSYRTDSVGIYCVTSGLASTTARNLFHDTTGAAMYAVGDSVWKALDSGGAYEWEKVISSPVGVRDLRYLDAYFAICGDNGLSAIAFVDPVFVASGNPSAATKWDLLIPSGAGHEYPTMRTAINTGSRAVFAGVGGTILAGYDDQHPVMTCGAFSADRSTISTEIQAATPATLRDSSAWKINRLGRSSDSVVEWFSGELSGDIVRTEIVMNSTATLTDDVIAAESSFRMDATTNPAQAPMFSVGAHRLQIDGSSIEANGALSYSLDAAGEVALNNCTNSADFTLPLSNGFAKVSLSGCGPVRNASAYSIDGRTLAAADMLKLEDPITPTAAVVDWKGFPASSTTDGEYITLAAAMPLPPSYASTETARYINPSTPANGTAGVVFSPSVTKAMNLVYNLGGQLRLTVIYPESSTPSPKCKPYAMLVKPRLDLYNLVVAPRLDFHGVRNEAVAIGSRNPAGVASGTTVSTTNVWGALPLLYGSDTTTLFRPMIRDQWHDRAAGPLGAAGEDAYTVGMDAGTELYLRSPRIVICNDGAGFLPLGTKIKLEIIPSIPRYPEQFAAFFPEPDTSVDPIVGMERQAFRFCDGANALTVQRAVEPASEIQTAAQFGADQTTSTGFAVLADQTKTFPEMGNTETWVDVRLDWPDTRIKWGI